jgi:hypothetical protein
MKHILLFIFICISTCAAAQSFSYSFVADSDEYGISNVSPKSAEPSITIYPNPTTDFINIHDKNGVISTATLFNLLGKELVSIRVDGTSTYDMMAHDKGIYLVQLKDNQGQILQTVRLKKI